MSVKQDSSCYHLQYGQKLKVVLLDILNLQLIIFLQFDAARSEKLAKMLKVSSL